MLLKAELEKDRVCVREGLASQCYHGVLDAWLIPFWDTQIQDLEAQGAQAIIEVNWKAVSWLLFCNHQQAEME